MKTISINLYSFAELNEKIQDKVIENNYDLNVSHDWWQQVYEDAQNIGLKITSFDIDRANYCKGTLTVNFWECINTIFSEHGEQCETYQTALKYKNEAKEIEAKYDGKEETIEEETEFTEMEENFVSDLLEDYKIMLRNEYEYLTSRESIIETIEANEYTFEADGTMNNG